MSGYFIRNMEITELAGFYRHVERDFAAGEYAPYDVLYQQLNNGVQRGMVLCRNNYDVAYSICADSCDNEYVLISLLAVFEEFRGKGGGTAFLQELIKVYADKKGMVVEVEKPENANTQDERDLCIKRIRFYENAGFYLIPDIDYSIWDVSMHLMALPQNALKDNINKNIGDIIYEIYLLLMGKRYINKMKIKKIKI